MSDMNAVIIPKSDQLNADDLIAGPITIKIASVTIRPGTEQPISIHYEGDKGKPYKACKSMCRVMVTAWGADSKLYTGRSMTLYRDASVKWGGMEVGGIRISHMSDIDSAITMALTMTKASRKPFTVRPLAVTSAEVVSASEPAPEEQPDANIIFALESCLTTQELSDVWLTIPKGKRKLYEAAKDTRKTALASAASEAAL